MMIAAITRKEIMMIHKIAIGVSCTTMVLALSLILGINLGITAKNKTPDPTAARKVGADMALRCAALAKDRAIRLAVLPFTPTQAQFSAEAGCGFGAYFTEGLIGALGAHPEKIRLFERSRLDAITKENALSLSGLISREEAKKIGELAPIDYILTGTFTKLTSYIEVDGRILDVVSGEIKAAFSQRIEVTPDIRSLFPLPAASAPAGDRGAIAPDEGKNQAPPPSACPPGVALLANFVPLPLAFRVDSSAFFSSTYRAHLAIRCAPLPLNESHPLPAQIRCL